MSKAELRAAACDGKQRFHTPAIAHHVRRRQARSNHNDCVEVYRCKHCGGWHLGRSRDDYVKVKQLIQRRER